MAENKKSFVLYCDLIHTVKKMNDADAGQLLKTILSYVNDEGPVVENMIVDLVFEPIKRQMKRDLEKWEEKIDKRSDAGMKSAGKKSFEKWLRGALSKGIDKISSDEHLFEAGRCSKYMAENYGTFMFYHYDFAREWHQQMATNSTSVDFVEQTPTKSTVTDTDTVTVNDTSFKKEAKEIFSKVDISDNVLEQKITSEKLDTGSLPPITAKGKNKNEIDFTFCENSPLKEILIRWLNYKKWKGQRYKGQDSVETMFKKLCEYSNNDPTTAVEIIEDAIAKNYSGFFKPTKQITQNGNTKIKPGANNFIGGIPISEVASFHGKSTDELLGSAGDGQ